MDTTFLRAYKQLNEQQKQAVDTIDGPLLIIAGPGTGKTQLLSTRAANIVKAGAVGPANILCLTYTDAGATEMRQRLIRIMGPNGGDVTVHTFHSFGSWLIREYPEQFSTTRSQTPLDKLGRYRIIEQLMSSLPLRHPLAIRGDEDKFVWQAAVGKGIEAFKKAGLSPDELRAVLNQNKAAYTELHHLVRAIFDTTLSAKRLPAIRETVEQAIAKAADHTYLAIVLATLETAIVASEELGKTAPLGKWRTDHTTIENKQRILKSASKHALVNDLIQLYEDYQAQLIREGRYDYDDMILHAVKALETNQDLRLDLAERFQYIMVDEYQDTSGAQNRLLDELLQAHPSDTPNVMVVGDDEQAVMRFQGAEVSGMLRFIELYQPKIIVLRENYRSGQVLLDASRQIITQTDERLESQLPALKLSKQLVAKNEPAQVCLEHTVHISPAAEYSAVADQVKRLLNAGVSPTDIAIIGRKHAVLINCVPFLLSEGIVINYDRRASVLDHHYIQEVLDLAAYVQSLHANPKRAAALLPTILSANYWQLTPLSIYQLAITAQHVKASWLDTMLASTDTMLQQIAEWLIVAAAEVKNANFTLMLDILIGRQALPVTLGKSPFKAYLDQQSPELYATLLSHLICLRSAVLENRPHARSLEDLLEVAAEYRRSGIELVDDNPILHGATDAVRVLSAHSAKGREFEHVFIISAVDDVWGSRGRGGGITITLPENLPLYPAGDAESDKLRLLYVAMTRAKSALYISSYAQNNQGKAVTPLSYLQLGDDETGWWQATEQSLDSTKKETILEAAWQPHSEANSQTLIQVLEPVLSKYQLSASALNSFLDIRYAGPLACLEQHVLKYPSAYNAHSALGNAAHEVVRLAQSAFKTGQTLNKKQLISQFDAQLDASGLPEAELRAVRDHGQQFLPRFIANFSQSDFASIVASEGYLSTILPDINVPFGGKLDAIAKDEIGFRVIDYKTGKPPLPNWETKSLSDSKKTSLHFYRQQLMCYKLLVEHSSQYAGKGSVVAAELIFLEADSANNESEASRLTITEFDQSEMDRTKQLMKTVYERLLQANLPSIDDYSKDLKGILRFEDDLLNGAI